jgi:hypothetical protein
MGEGMSSLAESLTISQFPSLVEEFRAKRWALLWQGSRDDFRAAEFQQHRRVGQYRPGRQ